MEMPRHLFIRELTLLVLIDEEEINLKKKIGNGQRNDYEDVIGLDGTDCL